MPACVCRSRSFMTYAFFHKTWSPQARTSANILTGSSCSNSHLHILMHINTHSYQILFVCGTCSQNLSLIYPSNILRVLLIVTCLKIAYCVSTCLTHCLTLLYLPFCLLLAYNYCHLCIPCLLHKVLCQKFFFLHLKKKVSSFLWNARGSRWAVAIIKLNLCCLIRSSTLGVPSKVDREEAGQCEGSPWVVLRIFRCTRSSIEYLESTCSSEPYGRMGIQKDW